MSMINSSGAQERFAIAPGENKTFQNEIAGGNSWEIDVHVDNQETSSAIVGLKTSEDNSTYTLVGSAVTVVPCGYSVLTGATGKFAQIVNTGTALAWVVAKPLRIVQVIPNI